MKTTRKISKMLFGGASVFLVTLISVSDTAGQCVIPPSGLIHWWPGDTDGSDIQGGNNFVLMDGAQAGVAGKVAGAFSFDGANDFVQSQSNSTLTGNPSFTIEAWIKITGPCCVGNYPPILFWGNNATGQSVFFALQDQNIDKLFVGFFNGGQKMSGAFNGGAFHHVAWVRTGGGVSDFGNALFIDGQPVFLVDDLSPGITPNIQPGKFFINRAEGGRFFGGIVDEVSIYNRALSLVEIEAIVTADIAGKCKSVFEDFTIFADFTITNTELQFSKFPSGNDQFLVVNSQVTLGASNNGIEPLFEEVKLTFGTYTLTVPANSFEKRGRNFFFSQPGGPPLIRISRVWGDTFNLSVHVRNVDLSDTANPVRIELSIGDDVGETEIPFNGVLHFP